MANYSTLPEHCAVRVVDEESQLHGATGFVANTDITSDGETLADDWFEVVFRRVVRGKGSDWYGREEYNIFHIDDLCVNGC